MYNQCFLVPSAALTLISCYIYLFLIAGTLSPSSWHSLIFDVASSLPSIPTKDIIGIHSCHENLC